MAKSANLRVPQLWSPPEDWTAATCTKESWSKAATRWIPGAFPGSPTGRPELDVSRDLGMKWRRTLQGTLPCCVPTTRSFPISFPFAILQLTWPSVFQLPSRRCWKWVVWNDRILRNPTLFITTRLLCDQLGTQKIDRIDGPSCCKCVQVQAPEGHASA